MADYYFQSDFAAAALCGLISRSVSLSPADYQTLVDEAFVIANLMSTKARSSR